MKTRHYVLRDKESLARTIVILTRLLAAAEKSVPPEFLHLLDAHKTSLEDGVMQIRLILLACGLTDDQIDELVWKILREDKENPPSDEAQA